MSSIYKSFRENALSNLDKVAIICNTESVTYGELLEKTEAFSELLRQSGCSAGTAVGLFQCKSIDYAIYLFAVLKLDAVVVPFNTGWTEEEVSDAIKNADIELMIYEGKIKKCSASLGDHKEDRIFLMTSGSTGVPKIVRLTEDAMKVRLDMEIEEFNLTREDVVLIATPVYHSLGLRLLMTSLYIGAEIILPKVFTPHGWIKDISEYKVTYTITVPSHIKQILIEVGGRYEEYSEKLKSIRVILSTSAYLPEDTKSEFIKVIRGEFYNFIASSETEFIAKLDCKRQHGENILGFPFAGTKLAILKDNNDFGKSGEVGEIVCSSRQLFHGYYNNAEMTKNAFYNGYYRTGDLGFLDEAGCVHYAGRKKNVVICSGVNIYPCDIEKILKRCEGVSDSVAYAVSNDKCGEILAIMVATSKLSVKDIKRFCLENMAPYQQPRLIRIVDSIPRNEMGKVSWEAIKE